MKGEALCNYKPVLFWLKEVAAMQSSLIGKIEKAKRYAQETDRITFSELSVQFRGDNNDYRVEYKDEKWQCSCAFFSNWGLCSHTMALEKILSNMLPPEARTTQHEDNR
jgi:hypothetical protein